MKVAGKISCTIVTGFLGAGKTSLIDLLLLEHPIGEIAVLLQEEGRSFQNFSTVDADLKAEDSFGIDGTQRGSVDSIRYALCELLTRQEQPARIVVELSGIDTPRSMLEVLAEPTFASRIVCDGIINVIDGYALSCFEFAGRRDAFRRRHSVSATTGQNAVAAIFEEQLRPANVVLINKIDLITSRDRAEITNFVRDLTAVSSPIFETCGGRLPNGIPMARLLAPTALRLQEYRSDMFSIRHSKLHTTCRVAVKLPLIACERELHQRLVSISEIHNTLRMKGVAHIASRSRPVAIEGVGRRIRLEPLQGTKRPGAHSGYIAITSEQHLSKTDIQRELSEPPPHSCGTLPGASRITVGTLSRAPYVAGKFP